MQTFILPVLGAFAMAGLIRFRWQGFLTTTLLTLGLLLVFVTGGRLYLQQALEGAYGKDQIIAQMQVLEEGRPARVHKVPP